MYVYRFLNKEGEIIYIGKAKNINKRLSNHKHLSKECYDEKDKIEYITLLNNDESSLYERYLINKQSPKYNQQYNNNSSFSFDLPEKEWKKYKSTDFNKIRKKGVIIFKKNNYNYNFELNGVNTYKLVKDILSLEYIYNFNHNVNKDTKFERNSRVYVENFPNLDHELIIEFKNGDKIIFEFYFNIYSGIINLLETYKTTP